MEVIFKSSLLIAIDKLQCKPNGRIVFADTQLVSCPLILVVPLLVDKSCTIRTLFYRLGQTCLIEVDHDGGSWFLLAWCLESCFCL